MERFEKESSKRDKLCQVGCSVCDRRSATYVDCGHGFEVAPAITENLKNITSQGAFGYQVFI